LSIQPGNLMELPALLPKSLVSLAELTSEDELLTEIYKEPRHAVLFFEVAAGDETWSKSHQSLMKNLFEWLTKEHLSGKISSDLAHRVASAYQKHHQILQNILPNDLRIFVGNEEFLVNSLLFGSSSSYFNSLLSAQGADFGKTEVHISSGTAESFHVVKEFFETGTVEDLWKLDKDQVVGILKDLKFWENKDLIDFSSEILRRYINKVNVIDFILLARENNWEPLHKIALETANTYETGIVFDERPIDSLGIEFLDFRENALDIFQRLKSAVTHLTFHGDALEDARFSDIVTQSTNLRGLDLRQTNAYTNRLLDIPTDIEELHVAMCPWVTNEVLKQLLTLFQKLKVLNVSSNRQITFQGWSHLRLVKNLEGLDLSRCQQITDDDLKLIVQTLPQLQVINLEECSRITDQGIISLAKLLPKLSDVNLSRDTFTDIALIELSSRLPALRKLNLTRCIHITDAGVYDACRYASALKTINITHCGISEDTVKKIQELRPYLQIIYI
jgi:F-box/leucine-rich repeat protein 2/20